MRLKKLFDTYKVIDPLPLKQAPRLHNVLE
jgi:hypothetical protein